MYLMPNKIPVDVEGAIEAMLDDDISNVYFFDIEKGKVCCIESEKDGGDKKIKEISKKIERYFKLPRISKKVKEKWLKSFVKEMISPEDLGLSKKLLKHPEKNYYDTVLEIIEKSEEGWIHGWAEWSHFDAYEIFEDWIYSLPVEIDDEWDGCENCAICRAMESGKDSIPELLKVFSEQNFINEAEEIIKSGRDEKNKRKLVKGVGVFESLFIAFPDLGDNDIRKIILQKDTFGLPKGKYYLLESYCTDRKCDCRKVMINVVNAESPQEILATIGFGWETAEYYTKWFGDKKTGEQMVGSYLEPGCIQTSDSEKYLKLTENSLKDKSYIALLIKHYEDFKNIL
jgi:hypothetical protein